MSTLTPTRPTRLPSRMLHPAQKQVSVGILSTYPPTACGLATFSAALVNGLYQAGVTDIGVVSVGDDDSLSDSPNVVGQLIPRDALSISRVAQLLNRYDIVIIQHEYGIYGGDHERHPHALTRQLGRSAHQHVDAGPHDDAHAARGDGPDAE